MGADQLYLQRAYSYVQYILYRTPSLVPLDVALLILRIFLQLAFSASRIKVLLWFLFFFNPHRLAAPTGLPYRHHSVHLLHELLLCSNILASHEPPIATTVPMGVFNQKSKFKAPVPTIRKEVVAVEPPKPKPKLKHAPSSSSGSSSLRVNSRHVKAASRSPRLSPSFRKSTSPHTAAASSDESRKRKLGNGNHRPSPASDRVEFGDDSDTDDNWEDALDARKRRKRAMMNGHRRVDLNRKLAHPRLLEPPSEEGGDGADLAIIHAADVANLSLKCVPVLGASEEETPVTLQYPGMRERERYVAGGSVLRW